MLIINLPDSQERLSFLNSVAAKVNDPKSQDAYVYAIVAVATVKLELQDLSGSRADLDNAEKILDHFDSVETIVHAAFYRVNADYYQVCPFEFMRYQAYKLTNLSGKTRFRIILSKRPIIPRVYRPGRSHTCGEAEPRI